MKLVKIEMQRVHILTISHRSSDQHFLRENWNRNRAKQPYSLYGGKVGFVAQFSRHSLVGGQFKLDLYGSESKRKVQLEGKHRRT